MQIYGVTKTSETGNRQKGKNAGRKGEFCLLNFRAC
jgi:hypothetical protein